MVLPGGATEGPVTDALHCGTGATDGSSCTLVDGGMTCMSCICLAAWNLQRHPTFALHLDPCPPIATHLQLYHRFGAGTSSQYHPHSRLVLVSGRTELHW